MRHDAICQTLQAWRQEVKEKTSQSLGGGQQGGIHRVFFSRVPTIARFLPPDDDDGDDDDDDNDDEEEEKEEGEESTVAPSKGSPNSTDTPWAAATFTTVTSNGAATSTTSHAAEAEDSNAAPAPAGSVGAIIGVEGRSGLLL